MVQPPPPPPPSPTFCGNRISLSRVTSFSVGFRTYTVTNTRNTDTRAHTLSALHRWYFLSLFSLCFTSFFFSARSRPAVAHLGCPGGNNGVGILDSCSKFGSERTRSAQSFLAPTLLVFDAAARTRRSGGSDARPRFHRILHSIVPLLCHFIDITGVNVIAIIRTTRTLHSIAIPINYRPGSARRGPGLFFFNE